MPYEGTFTDASTSSQPHHNSMFSKPPSSPLRHEEVQHGNSHQSPIHQSMQGMFAVPPRLPSPSSTSLSPYHGTQVLSGTSSTSYISVEATPLVRRKPVPQSQQPQRDITPTTPQSAEARDEEIIEAMKNFDLEELGRGGLEEDELPAEVSTRLREAAQEYVSQPASGPPAPKAYNNPPTSTANNSSNKRRSWFRPKEDKNRRPISELQRNATNESMDQDEGEDPNFCCTDAKRAAMINDPSASYCYGCHITFCERCWSKQLVHRKKRPGHDKVNAAVAKLIEDTLEVDVSETEQAELHLIDEGASWFGAIHGHDGVIFRDFGRYAGLMADKSLAHKRSCYPALISFVGETGAGKSSLIKLLVGVITKKTAKEEKPPQVR